MKPWLLRRRRRYPRLVPKPKPRKVLHLHVNDGQGVDYERRISEAIGAVRRAEHRGRTT